MPVIIQVGQFTMAAVPVQLVSHPGHFTEEILRLSNCDFGQWSILNLARMVVFIRRVSEPSVSHICLLMVAAGYSAADRHEYGEFTGLVYSVLPRKYERVAEETW